MVEVFAVKMVSTKSAKGDAGKKYKEHICFCSSWSSAERKARELEREFRRLEVKFLFVGIDG